MGCYVGTAADYPCDRLEGEGMNSSVLIDGYLRLKAVQRCGRYTVVAEIWGCKGFSEAFKLFW